MAGGVRWWLAAMAMAGLATGAPGQEKGPDNPKPAEGDFILPMPGGGSMVFRPVFLDVGSEAFAGREVKLGDRAAGGYKEYPTATVLGGAFLGDHGGRQDWMYYLGKYEVTERQFDAVMNPGAPNEKTEPKSEVSWFEVQDFIHRYNLWLMQSAKDKLPTLDESSGFLRLPTESEWEFAARGGRSVSEGEFDKKHPYGKNLTRHEWFSGPKSSFDKIKKAGVLEPNPLGLHDMLGNVSEMTASGYQIEYVQGRSGGLTARGGNFRTPENQMRSSLRTEQPFYRADGTVAAQKELGFRLLIAAPVFAGRQTAQALSDQWDAYRETRPVPGTAQQSTGPTSGKTAYSLDDARKSLDRVEAGLKAASGVTEETQNALGLLKASFGDVQSIIAQAERDSGEAWARIAGHTGLFLCRELKKVADSERVLAISKQLGRTADIPVYEARLKNLLQNIEESKARYGDSMKELGKLTPEAVRAGFKKNELYLIEKGLDDQIKVQLTVMKQYEEYAQTKRLNLDEWVEVLGTLELVKL